jgi:hypothetical protein
MIFNCYLLIRNFEMNCQKHEQNAFSFFFNLSYFIGLKMFLDIYTSRNPSPTIHDPMLSYLFARLERQDVDV